MRHPDPISLSIEFSVVVSILMALYSTPSAQAADIAGKAQIADDATINIAGWTIQLEGILAPVFTKQCGPAANEWHCGKEAALVLADIFGRIWVECDLRDARTLQRLVGVCPVGRPKGRDLGAWMVKRGWTRAAGHCAAMEEATKTSGIGLCRCTRPR